MLFVGAFAHVGGQRADQTVTQQNTEERADQRGGHLFSDFFGRSAESAHGDNHAEDRRDNAEAGQGVGHRGQCGDGHGGAVMVDVHVQLHHLVHVEGLDAPTGGHADGVADKVQGVVVL